MKKLLKLSTYLFLASVIFQSCESDDSQEENIIDDQNTTIDLPENEVSDGQNLSINLVEKVIATGNSVNDYNFFVDRAEELNVDCEFPSTLCYFNNPQGDYYEFSIIVDSLDSWLTEYIQAKQEAMQTTGATFTDEDFVLSQMNYMETGFQGLTTREEFIDYFEDCNTVGFSESLELGVSFSEVNTNCNNSDLVLTLAGESITVSDIQDLEPIETFLNSVNGSNNQSFTLDDITVLAVTYGIANDEEVFFTAKEDVLNYFDDCLFNRTINNNDCLNFVYPLDINDSEEVVNIANDEELVNTFSTEDNVLGFVFPISLIDQEGNIITIENNEVLESTLNDSETYCN